MPSKEIIQKALKSITRRANYDYFFLKLESPAWILPLRESGLFSNPPAVEIDGQYIRHHHWPESQYLMRVAEQEPAIVTETILRVPETDNERVHEDFVEAALKMPVKWARKIAKKELEWIRAQKQFYFLYPDYVAKLIVKLLEEGQVDLAIELAEGLLDVDCVEREIGSPGDEGYHKRVEVTARFSTWEYKRVVEKIIPAMAAVGGQSSIQVLCRLLEKAIEMDLSEPNPPHDYSYIWLTAIEDHEQNRHADSDLKAILATGVRDASLQVLDGDRLVMPELVAMLEGNKWAIFKRIALFLISQFADDFPEQVSERLTDKGLFEDDTYRHEYALLAKAGFGLLSSEEKEVVLSWIDEGPDLDAYRKNVLGNTGHEPTEDEIQRRIRYWQRDHLDQFKEALPKEWKQRFDELEKELGEAEHPDFSYYSSGGWVGPTSPKSAEDLKQMSVAEVVDYLKTWVPPEGHFVETPEGLSRTFAQAVSDDPVRFAEAANMFIDLDPTYVRGLIDGLRDVPKNRDDLAWGSLLELFQWVVKQGREPPETEIEHMERDPGWSWCRKSIANLLSSGLKSCPSEIPIEFRNDVWPLIEELSNDPDPDAAKEEYGEGQMDPSTRSINSVRGEAMHAAVDYGLWVYRNSEETDKDFELMPELRAVLERHLDIENDPSLAIRSVYGRWFPWLHLMDSTWAESNREKVFSSDSSVFRDAAWKSYITFCQPFDLMLEVLRKQYAQAIANIETPSEVDIRLADAEQRLADHLLVFYWRGKIDLDDPLIQSFYAKANVKLKAHAMEFLGRSLRGTPEDIPAEVQDRLKAFWAWRFAQAIEAEEPGELADYCWWFASGAMDADWMLTQFRKVLELSIKFDALDFAAEELVKMMAEYPVAVLDCLGLMIGHLKTEGVYFGWNDEAKMILSEAMQFDDGPVKEQAIEIIHRLGAMGHFEFRELL
jgi:hypothetical protein